MAAVQKYPQDYDGVVAAVRSFSGKHSIQHCSERVNIPPRVRNRFQGRLFGRHVEQSSERRSLFVRQSRLTEIRQSWFVFLIEQNIRRLQIAMQHSLAVSVQQSCGDFPEHLDGFANGQRSVFR